MPKKAPHRSGFAAKLSAWLAAGREAELRGQVMVGPSSPRRLAAILTAAGEPVSRDTIERWRSGVTLPEARYIASLERLMGAPWSYLDDPCTPWPRPVTRAAIADLLDLFDPDALDRLEAMARAQLRLDAREGTNEKRAPPQTGG